MAQVPALRYLKVVGCVAAALMAAAGAVNWAADPLGVFGTPLVAGVNARKPYLNHDRELARFALAQRHCRQARGAATGNGLATAQPTAEPATTSGLAGIFGNSRAEIGFDPEHAAFERLGLKAFNHAIPGMTLRTPAKQFRWLEATGCLPQRAIVGVDFFDFLGGRPGQPLGAKLPLPEADLPFFATAVFSLSGVRDAFTTLRLQQQQHAPELSALGFNPLREYESEVATLGHYRLFRQRAEESYARWSERANRLTTTEGQPSRDQMALDDLLATAVRNGVPVDLVVYPYHAELRFIAYQQGTQPLYEQWLREMVATATRHNLAWAKTPAGVGGAPLVRVWNFGSVTTETLEPIPQPGDRKTALRHYWEAGHFKPALGGAVLEQVLGNGKVAGFGEELTPTNIEAAVVADRTALLQAWRGEHALRAEVQSLAQRPASQWRRGT